MLAALFLRCKDQSLLCILLKELEHKWTAPTCCNILAVNLQAPTASHHSQAHKTLAVNLYGAAGENRGAILTHTCTHFRRGKKLLHQSRVRAEEVSMGHLW